MRRLLERLAIVAAIALSAMIPLGAGHAQSQQAAVQFPTGKWAGSWTSGENSVTEVMPATLEIQSIELIDGKTIASGVSAWEDSPALKTPAGVLTFKKGEITGNKLVIGRNIVLEFELQPDGSLKGRRIVGGQIQGSITMRKVATSAAKN